MRRDDWQRVRGEEPCERIDDDAAHAGAAGGERDDLDRQRETGNGFTQRRADTDSVRKHEVTLQLREVGVVDAL